jgi:hypothetical protein
MGAQGETGTGRMNEPGQGLFFRASSVDLPSTHEGRTGLVESHGDALSVVRITGQGADGHAPLAWSNRPSRAGSMVPSPWRPTTHGVLVPLANSTAIRRHIDHRCCV